MRPDVSWLLIQWHLSGPKSQSRINSKFDRRLSAANCMGSTGRFDFLSSSLPSETPWKAHSLVKSQLIRPTRSKPWIIDENSYRKKPSTFAAQQDSVDDVSVPEGSAEIPHHWSAEAGTAKRNESMCWDVLTIHELESRGIEGKRGIQHHHSKKVQKSQKSQKDI